MNLFWEVTFMAEEFRKNEYVKVNQKKYDMLINLFGELTVNRNILENESKKANNTVISEVMEQDRRVVNNIHEIISKIKMSSLEELFSYIISNIKDKYDDIEFTTERGDIELDINIIEKIEASILKVLLCIIYSSKKESSKELSAINI
jgi:chemotaxis protein histidine kinase CheA